MDRQQAIADIDTIFAQYHTLLPEDQDLLDEMSDGKLYEVFVLATLIERLTNAGFHIVFRGQDLKFKAGPGMIKTSDPHFEITDPSSGLSVLWIFVDIEFETIGHHHANAFDNSRRHEVDIAVVSVNAGYPSYTEIALAVECKTAANFKKSILKEVLGVRREMAFYSSQTQPSLLSQINPAWSQVVMSSPPSEFWVAFTDPKGQNYEQGPAVFGITLMNLEP